MDIYTELVGRQYRVSFREMESLLHPVEVRVKALTRRGFIDQPFCSENKLDSDVEEFTVPRLYVNEFVNTPRHRKCEKYFNKESVRAYLGSRGVDVDNVDCGTVMGDHTLRRALDHVMSISALTLKYEDPDPKAFVARMPKTSKNVPEPAPVKQTSYEAYDSDFRINYIPPPVAKDHTSATTPSYYQLFLAVIDAVQEQLLKPVGSQDLKFLKAACLHYDLFTGQSNPCVDAVYDILIDYRNMGWVKMVKEHENLDLKTLESVMQSFVPVGDKNLPKLGSLKPHLGVSFQPGGYFLPTFLGFSDYMQEMNIINTTTPLAGGSAGSIAVAMSTVHTINRYDCMNIVDAMLDNAMHHSQRGILRVLVSQGLRGVSLPGTYEAANKRIGTIQINTVAKADMKLEPRITVHFKDDLDYLAAVEASCNVPGFYTLGPLKHRGEDSYDGVFAVDPYFVGASQVAGKRIVRLIAMPIGYGRRIRKSLQNDVANSFLLKKEPYIVHFIRLKSLFTKFLQRRLQHADAGSLHLWEKEVELAINVYNIVNSGRRDIRSEAKVIDEWLQMFSKAPRPHGYSEPKDCKLVELFKIVVASEQALRIGRDSTKHAGGIEANLQGINIIKTYADPKYPSKSGDVTFMSTPYTLLDWLEHELFLLNGSMQRKSTKGEQEIKLLRAILHNLSPPAYLNYYFTELPYLIPTPYTRFRNIIYAFKPSTPTDARYMFDVGRVTAFRWLIAEYISFENWLYLRIKQLQQDPSSTVWSPQAWKEQQHEEAHQKGKLIHQRQYQQVDECINMLDPEIIRELKANFSNRGLGNNLKLEVFKLRNRLVRRAILYGAVDPYYTHILTHRHFWIN